MEEILFQNILAAIYASPPLFLGDPEALCPTRYQKRLQSVLQPKVSTHKGKRQARKVERSSERSPRVPFSSSSPPPATSFRDPPDPPASTAALRLSLCVLVIYRLYTLLVERDEEFRQQITPLVKGLHHWYSSCHREGCGKRSASSSPLPQAYQPEEKAHLHKRDVPLLDPVQQWGLHGEDTMESSEDDKDSSIPHEKKNEEGDLQEDSFLFSSPSEYVAWKRVVKDALYTPLPPSGTSLLRCTCFLARLTLLSVLPRLLYCASLRSPEERRYRQAHARLVAWERAHPLLLLHPLFSRRQQGVDPRPPFSSSLSSLTPEALPPSPPARPPVVRPSLEARSKGWKNERGPSVSSVTSATGTGAAGVTIDRPAEKEDTTDLVEEAGTGKRPLSPSVVLLLPSASSTSPDPSTQDESKVGTPTRTPKKKKKDVTVEGQREVSTSPLLLSSVSSMLDVGPFSSTVRFSAPPSGNIEKEPHVPPSLSPEKRRGGGASTPHANFSLPPGTSSSRSFTPSVAPSPPPEDSPYAEDDGKQKRGVRASPHHHDGGGSTANPASLSWRSASPPFLLPPTPFVPASRSPPPSAVQGRLSSQGRSSTRSPGRMGASFYRLPYVSRAYDSQLPSIPLCTSPEAMEKARREWESLQQELTLAYTAVEGGEAPHVDIVEASRSNSGGGEESTAPPCLSSSSSCLLPRALIHRYHKLLHKWAAELQVAEVQMLFHSLSPFQLQLRSNPPGRPPHEYTKTSRPEAMMSPPRVSLFPLRTVPSTPRDAEKDPMEEVAPHGMDTKRHTLTPSHDKDEKEPHTASTLDIDTEKKPHEEKVPAIPFEDPPAPPLHPASPTASGLEPKKNKEKKRKRKKEPNEEQPARVPPSKWGVLQRVKMGRVGSLTTSMFSVSKKWLEQSTSLLSHMSASSTSTPDRSSSSQSQDSNTSSSHEEEKEKKPAGEEREKKEEADPVPPSAKESSVHEEDKEEKNDRPAAQDGHAASPPFVVSHTHTTFPPVESTPPYRSSSAAAASTSLSSMTPAAVGPTTLAPPPSSRLHEGQVAYRVAHLSLPHVIQVAHENWIRTMLVSYATLSPSPAKTGTTTTTTTAAGSSEVFSSTKKESPQESTPPQPSLQDGDDDAPVVFSTLHIVQQAQACRWLQDPMVFRYWVLSCLTEDHPVHGPRTEMGGNRGGGREHSWISGQPRSPSAMISSSFSMEPSPSRQPGGMSSLGIPSSTRAFLRQAWEQLYASPPCPFSPFSAVSVPSFRPTPPPPAAPLPTASLRREAATTTTTTEPALPYGTTVGEPLGLPSLVLLWNVQFWIRPRRKEKKKARNDAAGMSSLRDDAPVSRSASSSTTSLASSFVSSSRSTSLVSTSSAASFTASGVGMKDGEQRMGSSRSTSIPPLLFSSSAYGEIQGHFDAVMYDETNEKVLGVWMAPDGIFYPSSSIQRVQHHKEEDGRREKEKELSFLLPLLHSSTAAVGSMWRSSSPPAAVAAEGQRGMATQWIQNKKDMWRFVAILRGLLQEAEKKRAKKKRRQRRQQEQAQELKENAMVQSLAAEAAFVGKGDRNEKDVNMEKESKNEEEMGFSCEGIVSQYVFDLPSPSSPEVVHRLPVTSPAPFLDSSSAVGSPSGSTSPAMLQAGEVMEEVEEEDEEGFSRLLHGREEQWYCMWVPHTVHRPPRCCSIPLHAWKSAVCVCPPPLVFKTPPQFHCPSFSLGPSSLSSSFWSEFMERQKERTPSEEKPPQEEEATAAKKASKDDEEEHKNLSNPPTGGEDAQPCATSPYKPSFFRTGTVMPISSIPFTLHPSSASLCSYYSIGLPTLSSTPQEDDPKKEEEKGKKPRPSSSTEPKDEDPKQTTPTRRRERKKGEEENYFYHPSFVSFPPPPSGSAAAVLREYVEQVMHPRARMVVVSPPATSSCEEGGLHRTRTLHASPWETGLVSPSMEEQDAVVCLSSSFTAASSLSSVPSSSMYAEALFLLPMLLHSSSQETPRREEKVEATPKETENPMVTLTTVVSSSPSSSSPLPAPIAEVESEMKQVLAYLRKFSRCSLSSSGSLSPPSAVPPSSPSPSPSPPAVTALLSSALAPLIRYLQCLVGVTGEPTPPHTSKENEAAKNESPPPSPYSSSVWPFSMMEHRERVLEKEITGQWEPMVRPVIRPPPPAAAADAPRMSREEGRTSEVHPWRRVGNTEEQVGYWKRKMGGGRGEHDEEEDLGRSSVGFSMVGSEQPSLRNPITGGGGEEKTEHDKMERMQRRRKRKLQQREGGLRRLPSSSSLSLSVSFSSSTPVLSTNPRVLRHSKQSGAASERPSHRSPCTTTSSTPGGVPRNWWAALPSPSSSVPPEDEHFIAERGESLEHERDDEGGGGGHRRWSPATSTTTIVSTSPVNRMVATTPTVISRGPDGSLFRLPSAVMTPPLSPALSLEHVPPFSSVSAAAESSLSSSSSVSSLSSLSIGMTPSLRHSFEVVVPPAIVSAVRPHGDWRPSATTYPSGKLISTTATAAKDGRGGPFLRPRSRSGSPRTSRRASVRMKPTDSPPPPLVLPSSMQVRPSAIPTVEQQPPSGLIPSMQTRKKIPTSTTTTATTITPPRSSSVETSIRSFHALPHQGHRRSGKVPHGETEESERGSTCLQGTRKGVGIGQTPFQVLATLLRRKHYVVASLLDQARYRPPLGVQKERGKKRRQGGEERVEHQRLSRSPGPTAALACGRHTEEETERKHEEEEETSFRTPHAVDPRDEEVAHEAGPSGEENVVVVVVDKTEKRRRKEKEVKSAEEVEEKEKIMQSFLSTMDDASPEAKKEAWRSLSPWSLPHMGEVPDTDIVPDEMEDQKEEDVDEEEEEEEEEEMPQAIGNSAWF